MVTGGSGYIGSWVVKEILEKGHTVRLTVRDKNKKSKLQHLLGIAEKAPGTLELWEADLMMSGSFDEAATGCDTIVHMASPFTLQFKDPQKELIEPALNGTKNVLNAATKSGTVKKVVLTSSVASVHGDNIDMQEKGLHEFTEEHFNDSSSVDHQPYSYSKVAAEKEAWKIYEAQNAWQLVVLNPSFVLGPSLTDASNSESLKLMKDMLSGRYYLGAPDIQFGFVDVRDVAHAHVLAVQKDDTQGRHILAERTMSIMDLANIIKDKYNGKYKLPIMTSPKPVLYMVGWMFGLRRKFIKRNVGYPIKLNATKSRQALGLTYRPIEDTVKDMIEQMHSRV